MGNAQFKLNEENTHLPVDQSFLQKYQKHVTIVDHALVGLAKGIDALQTTCQLFFQQHSKSADGQSKDISLSPSEGEVILIIQKIHECISDNKEVTIESTKNFFSFIKEMGEIYIENADEAFSSLSVNTYQSLLPEYKFQDSLFIDFYKKRNEHLKKEIETLQKENKKQQELIETLKKHQSCLLDNKELKNQIKEWIEQNRRKEERLEGGSSMESKCRGDLQKSTTKQPMTNNTQNQISKEEEAVTDCQAMNENIVAKLRKQVQILTEEKSNIKQNLQQKYIITQITTKKVIVQVFSRSYMSVLKEAEEDLLFILETEFSKRDMDLKVFRCKRSSQIVNDCPLLVTASHSVYRRKITTIDAAMQGIDYAENKAVVVFHQKEESDLPNEVKQYDKQYEPLGGVIHFGYKADLYSSPINKESTTEVIAFIEKYGKIQPNVVETYC